MQHITALPQPLLELVLIPNTNTYDKNALRQTCKLFKQTLDNNITCLALKAHNEQSCCSMLKILRRTEFMHSLRAVVLSAFSWNVDSLLESLPSHITSLTLTANSLSLEQLGKLPQLTDLNAENIYQLTGIEYISGLTRLACHCLHDSLAHLAPTLKHLRVVYYDNALDTAQLINLEILEIVHRIPANFFQTHSQLPLKHLTIYTDTCSIHKLAWCSAPTTLTRLIIKAELVYDVLPAVLPTSITHLQLQWPPSVGIEQAASTLPWLRSLDVCCAILSHTTVSWNSAFGSLSRLTNLRSLGVSVYNVDAHEFLDHQQVLSRLPELSRTAEQGVKLNVLGEDEVNSTFGYPCNKKSVWATHG